MLEKLIFHASCDFSRYPAIFVMVRTRRECSPERRGIVDPVQSGHENGEPAMKKVAPICVKIVPWCFYCSKKNFAELNSDLVVDEKYEEIAGEELK
jgi:hypothetical protein